MPITTEDLRHIGGTTDGKFFFITPEWVDKSKAPGHTKFPTPTFQDFIWNAIFQKHLFFSPNLLWLTIAALMYFLFPYNLENATNNPATFGPISLAFFQQRLPLWLVVVFGYVGFWHVTLLVLKWGDRSYVANRIYRLSKTIHNAFHNLIGVLVLVAVENIFCFLYSTGRLSFYTDREILSSPLLHLATFYWISIIPLWRDFHFYFAHRLIHYDALYRYIHSLHHRNTDIEPFSGESMHFCEHVYYYASYGPLLLCKVSPFIMLWNLVHLVLAPAASHSGDESSYQSDAFHYLHHRFFTYNYAGLGASFLDATFGSFLPQWPEKSTNSKQIKSNQQQQQQQQPPNGYSEKFLVELDAKATLWGMPTVDVLMYNVLAFSSIAIAFLAATPDSTFAMRKKFEKLSSSALFLRSESFFFGMILAGFGPVILAYLLNSIFAPKRNSESTAKDKSLSHMLIHWGMGLLCCPIAFGYLVMLCF